MRRVMKRKEEAVLVIGAGIAGIQASIDLADMGFRVHLVERTPSIGGRVAPLEKKERKRGAWGKKGDLGGRPVI